MIKRHLTCCETDGHSAPECHQDVWHHTRALLRAANDHGETQQRHARLRHVPARLLLLPCSHLSSLLADGHCARSGTPAAAASRGWAAGCQPLTESQRDHVGRDKGPATNERAAAQRSSSHDVHALAAHSLADCAWLAQRCENNCIFDDYITIIRAKLSSSKPHAH